MPVITNAGEYLITQQQQAGEPLIIDQMILANITGLDSDTLPSRDQSMPAPADVKIIKPITKDGLLNTNTVVYSTVFPSTDGTFDFNYMGLYSSAHDVIVAVAYVPLQTKIKTVGTDVGNVITKNFAIEFNAAADITGINISAESWQIDYTARLLSMDKHQRDLVKNIYGPSTFLNDAFKVKFEADKYYLTAGKAILGGINFDLEADLEIVPGALPQTVWLDVYQETSMMGVLNKHDVVINDGTFLTDYVAGSVEHTLVKLGVVNSSVDIVDGRKIVKKSLIVKTEKDVPRNIAELRNYRPEYVGQNIFIPSYYSGWGASNQGPVGGGKFQHDPDDSSSIDNGGTIIVTTNGDVWKRDYEDFLSVAWFGADPRLPDNHEFIQAAIDSFDTGDDVITGGEILLGKGVYNVSKPVHITNSDSQRLSSIRLKGDGMRSATIKAALGFVGNEVINMDVIAYSSIENLRIDGNGVAQDGIVLKAGGKAELDFEKLIVEGYINSGIRAEGFTITTGFTGIRCIGGMYGFNLTKVTSLKFDRCYGIENTKAGFRIDDATYCTMQSCASDRSEIGYHISNARGFSLTSCGAEYTRKSGFYFEASAALDVGVVGSGIVAKMDGCTTVECNQDSSSLHGGITTHQEDTSKIRVHLSSCVDFFSKYKSVNSTGVASNHIVSDDACRWSTDSGSIASFRKVDVPTICQIQTNGDGADIDICPIKSIYGKEGHYGGLLNIVVSNKRYNLEANQAANAIQYLMMVMKSDVTTDTVSVITSIGEKGFDTDFPEFSFSINKASNMLVASPKFTPIGTFYLYITPLSGVSI
jgi:hypothetical protein